MTIHQAAAFFAPLGRYRGIPLCVVATNDPAYLCRLADEGAAECAVGTLFHRAVTLVVERLRHNAEQAILDGHTIDPAVFHSLRLAATHNVEVLARSVADEDRTSRPRKPSPRQDDPQLLFAGGTS